MMNTRQWTQAGAAWMLGVAIMSGLRGFQATGRSSAVKRTDHGAQRSTQSVLETALPSAYLDTLLTRRLSILVARQNWSAVAAASGRLCRSLEATPEQRRFARECQFLASWHLGRLNSAKRALHSMLKARGEATFIGTHSLNVADARLEFARALQWRTRGMAIDQKLFAQAQSLKTWSLIHKARVANWDKDYKSASVYACALLARPLVKEWDRYEVLTDMYFAQSLLGHKTVAQQAARQFDEIARVPRQVWRAQLASEMHELRVLIGDAAPGDPINYPMPPPYAPSPGDGFWQSEDPARMGFKPAAVRALRQHLTLCQQSGADGCLVVYKGKIISEWYSPRYWWPMFAMSSTKSWTGLLAGMLIADGKIGGVDDPVSKYLPTWAEGRRADVTLKHLLTMTSGLAQLKTDRELDAFNADYNAYVMGMTPTHAPGNTWEYSNQGVQLLSPILDKAAGVPTQDYARERLFKPLGMDDTHLSVTPQGNAVTFADGTTTCRDFARLGLMTMNGGQWQGKQIVPASWVQASLQPCPQNTKYGYLWWRYDKPKGYAMLGYLDTSCYCFPNRHLMVVRMQSKPYLFARQEYEAQALKLFCRMAAR